MFVALLGSVVAFYVYVVLYCVALRFIQPLDTRLMQYGCEFRFCVVEIQIFAFIAASSLTLHTDNADYCALL